jgi:hypothetical protein
MQASPVVARELEAELERFLAPLIVWLDSLLDKRLVRTFVASIVALVEWRNRAHGLLLSELGAYICAPAHAPAGTKRLSNLLRSPKWEANLLSLYFWRQATQRLAALETAGETPLLIWDTSVLEKPESIASPDLGSVRSALQQSPPLDAHQAGLLSSPHASPLCAGLALARIAAGGAEWREWPAMRRGHALVDDPRPACQRPGREQRDFLQVCALSWRRRVLHVWDRGYAGRAWLDLALAFPVRFVVRWPNRYHLLGVRSGVHPVPAWRVAQGLRAWDSRLLSRCAAPCPTPHRRPGYSGLAS